MQLIGINMSDDSSSNFDYNDLTVSKLKELLDERGLGKNGVKADLVARLNVSDSEKNNGEVSAANISNEVTSVLSGLQASGALIKANIKASVSGSTVSVDGTFVTKEQQQHVFKSLQEIRGVSKINHTTKVEADYLSAKPYINDVNQKNQWCVIRAESGFALWILGWIFWIVNRMTLGLAYPFTTVAYYQQWASNVKIDGRRLKFTGTAGNLFGVWISTFILSVLTLGLYWIFIGKGNMARWIDNHLTWA
tara:strand:+ start:685 stop:1434 length:750 start_codon:yes stop_codon:yes gene_type:complete